jgi:5-(carboxyamino)imidazole ribonucleotide synthase
MKVGVLGGGQLGRMMALAGYRLGLQFRFFDTTLDVCAGQLGALHVGAFDDEAALLRFAAGLDAVTLEWENVPVAAAELLAARLPFAPPAGALRVSQDRLSEKTLFRRLSIGTARFADVTSGSELEAALTSVGLPAVLKTRRGGYDGKGQAVVRTVGEARAAFEAMSPAPMILESFVPFERELSIIAVRSTTGETVFYPLVENHHRDGILRVTHAPAPNLPAALQARAEEMARAVLDELHYAGVLTIELFQAGGDLLANEMAPRVHNSGHWTIDGAVTSQFENHVRAVLGLPLGDCSVIGASAMLNLIGAHPPLEQMLASPGAHVHLYGKSPRAARKIGHVNLCAEDAATLAGLLAAMQALVEAAADG